MTDRLTDDEIKALRNRIAVASPAPWHRCTAQKGNCQCGLVWSEDRPILAHHVERFPSEQDVANTHLAAEMRNAIDRLLDEIEERRRAERSVAAELAMGLDKEQWDGHLQPEPFDASGNPWCPTCKAWHERSPGTMLWIKCKDGGA